MSIRSQAELEYQYHARWAQVQSNTLSLEQAFGNMEDWVIQLGQRKAFLHPNLKLWMWHDRLHNSWVGAGCGIDEAVLITIGGVGGYKTLPQPEGVAGWCVYLHEQKVYEPLRTAELIAKLKTEQLPMDILVWSPLATSWLSVVKETGEEISFHDDAGNQVSVISKE